jgi:hypothetical protein
MPAGRVWLTALSRLLPRRWWVTQSLLLPRSWPGTAGWSHGNGITLHAADSASADRNSDQETLSSGCNRESHLGHGECRANSSIRLRHGIAASTVWQILHVAASIPHLAGRGRPGAASLLTCVGDSQHAKATIPNYVTKPVGFHKSATYGEQRPARSYSWIRDCAANGVFGPTRRAVVRWDGHCE